MFFWRHEEKPKGPIYDWIIDNKERILSGDADYMGTKVDEQTQFHQYKYVISLGLATLSFTTPHFLPTSANGYLRAARWKYGLISMLCGWWCFPWGPPFTVHAMMVSLNGGRKRTAANLLQLIEWGWDAPADVSVGAHQKSILSVSEVALEEIRKRMIEGGFQPEVGVRISPKGSNGPEVSIAFDYPVSDGRDWIDVAEGIPLLIDKDDEPFLYGRLIDYSEDVFSAIPHPPNG